MFEETWSSINRFRLPEVNGEMEMKRLHVCLVLEAVQAVCDREDRFGYLTRHVPAGQTRTLLTLLVYCYASGIYASDQIETQIASDPNLNYLAAGLRPTWHDLRRFRRQQRRLLQDALAKTLRSLSKLGPGRTLPTNRSPSSPQNNPSTMHGSNGVPARQFDSAAADRINEAILWDSMVLDD